MIFTPEPYQVKMCDHLLSHESAAALFVSPGLGKTGSTLDGAKGLCIDGDCKGVLVVAPKRVAVLTWPNEVKKWDQFGCLKPESIRGRKASGRSLLYTINYERLEELTDLSFCDTVVFDELTKAKNPKSKRINHVRKLFKGHRRWGLTGTPRPQGLDDLFAQVRLLDDGARLGRSYTQFRDRYMYATDWNEYSWSPKPGAEAEVYDKIKDLALTLRASDYLGIPDTIVEDIDVPLPDEAKAVYKKLEKELLATIGDGLVIAQSAGILVNKLLQITGGSVYADDRSVHHVHDGKIKALKSVLKDVNSAIIYTNYIHERERVVASIPGAVDASKFKGDIEDAWNSGRIKYLVADPRSLGHGLNMQGGGHTVVWFSLNYSRELYDQANARVARKGQLSQPVIYRLLSSGTIDDAVVEALRIRGDGQGEMMAVLSNLKQLHEAI